MESDGRKTGVQRDRAWIDREYGLEKWPAVLKQVQSWIAEGETQLSRLVGRINAWETGGGDFSLTSVVIAGRRVAMPELLAYSGFYTLVRESLLEACRRDAPELIVEMGSGWGRNLLDLWCAGGPAAARYIALEYTAAGRECARSLAALAPELAFDVHPFDFYRPDFAPVARGGRALVYTVFGIDQIPHIGRPVFEACLGLADEVTGIHLEPTGWQMAAADPDLTGGGEGSSEAYAARHDYNRNLWPVLTALAGEGRIVIEEVRADLYGANPENAASYVRWRKCRRGPSPFPQMTNG